MGLAILLLGWGLFSKQRLLVLAASILLLLSSNPLVSYFMIRSAEDWAVRSDAANARHADAIVVLSGGLFVAPGAAGVSEWSDADRFYGDVELFHAGKAPLLIFTGGGLHGNLMLSRKMIFRLNMPRHWVYHQLIS